ncbi:alpha-1,4-glucan--maltose-1-phosphate maltosyltransferase [Marinimicrobium sp. ABcell2]|uniref:alpha-1,4-glucan--maltose-1-phosphate maltosyltransferase n=1 Tax=Marinimicrobium sp. ABcell2 TaxID=3069751 RepID=UPI0027B47468|nr:alpha-1,4-glucan--maltose-1-phosphate maltosyltransferase [Marinimicrobium sp. ABcell2]MDQ2075834.1 alpha-1,4-glucan--maltose-1-phosphate maltosyltransferase [Marinimicrobium sp. ABcell2]
MKKSKTATKKKVGAKATRAPAQESGTSASATLSVEEAIAQPRVLIDRITPSVDEGRYPAKGVVGQTLIVNARIFTDGHNRLAARVLWKETEANQWHSRPMSLLGNDHWSSQFTPAKTGLHEFVIEAWLDRWQNYHHELHQKFYAGIPVSLEVEEGQILLNDIRDYAKAQDKLPESKREEPPGRIISHRVMSREHAELYLRDCLEQLEQEERTEQKAQLLLDPSLAEAVEVLEPHHFASRSRPLLVDVERTAAGYSAWYELFPRSITDSVNNHGTFDDVISRLPAIQAMGFDVLYFPPIHPIGERNRKGRNNTLEAKTGDPGSPYAIGSPEGGHDAVYSELGGIESFRRLRDAAREYGLELALDFAIQCAPDHPWLKEHPEWFSWRPDGSIRYAENPPKKYQDIVNVDFYAEKAKPDMWLAWRDIVLYWISEGVKIFRVDNPHTKPLAFWEWLIADVRSRHPEAIFLSEAFTRPAMMYSLAKIGFSQSYTYFIWRNSKKELTEYLTELSTTEVKDYYRPNFFVNTPDINPFFLQTAGRPGFLIRAALASTLSGLWGVYSGFEYCESAPLPGKEEYLNSEKYEIRPRDFDAPGNIVQEISRLNAIRKENPALHSHLHVQFYESSNDQVLYFGKSTPDRRNFILVAISLDPHHGQEVDLELPVEQFDLHGDIRFDVTELMRDQHFQWHGHRQHWYFNPQEIPFAIWRLQPRRA